MFMSHFTLPEKICNTVKISFAMVIGDQMALRRPVIAPFVLTQQAETVVS